MENTIKEEKKGWKIASIILNVVFYTLIAMLLLFSIANLATKNDDYKIPSLFGVGMITPEKGTYSMEGSNKDSFTDSELLIVKKVQVVDQEANEAKKDRQYKKLVRQTEKLEVGDIITFVWFDDSKVEYVLNTHRIIEVHEDSVTGSRYYVTQGDYAKEHNSAQTEIVNINDIRAIYKFKLNGLASVMRFIQSPNGFLLCIVLPTAIFFVVQLVFLILNIQKQRQEKQKEEQGADLEKLREEMLAQERERIKAEILAEQAQKAEAKDSVEEPNKSDSE